VGRCIAVLLAVAASTPALAQTDPEAADALFREGRRLMAAGQYDEACAKFLESDRAEPSVGALLNLAECELERDEPAAAWTAFRRAELLARAKKEGGRARFAARQKDRVGRSLGFVRIAVTPRWREAPDLAVKLSGRPVERRQLGVELPLEPGLYTLTATAGRAEPFTAELDVIASPDVTDVAIELRPRTGLVNSAPGPAPVAQTRVNRTQRIAGVSMAATGAATLIASVALGAAARSQYNSVKACGDREAPPCTLDEIATGDSARLKADVATGLFVAGVVVAGAGLAVWLTSDRERRAETPPTGEPLSVAPVIDGDQLGVMARGSF
jgi:hypothetical protein